MSFGKMNTTITLRSKVKTTDAEGFYSETTSVVATVKAYREDRHGSELWKNRASYTTATTLFRFRKIPGQTITADLYITCGTEKFEIYSVEDVKGKGMYIEVLAERMETSG